MKTKKKILITGGAGFIGSNFIRYMYKKYPEYEIYNLDSLTYAGNLQNLADIESIEKEKANKRYFFIKEDICNARGLEKVFKDHNFDVVVNFAAESHVDRSLVDSVEFIKTNILGTHILLNLVHKLGIRFVHISTDEVYGDVLDGYSTEESPMSPSNPYAASKAAADHLVQSYMRSHKTKAVIVRGSNNFGPYQYPEKLIPLVITNLIEGHKIPVHGSGEHIRTWIHTDDFCSGIDKVLHEAPDFSIYNIAGAEEKNIEVIRKICHILKKDFKDSCKYVGDRPGADMRYASNSSKLINELGWEPKFTLDNSLADIVKWYIENEVWWKDIKHKKEFTEHYEKQKNAQYY